MPDKNDNRGDGRYFAELRVGGAPDAVLRVMDPAPIRCIRAETPLTDRTTPVKRASRSPHGKVRDGGQRLRGIVGRRRTDGVPVLDDWPPSVPRAHQKSQSKSTR